MQSRLSELTDWAAKRIQSEIEQVRSAALGSVKREAGDLVAGAREGLRQSVQAEFPGLEKELVERCRKVAEPMLASQVEQWTLLLRDRLEQAQKSVAGLVQTAAEESASRCAKEMESLFDRLLDASVSRLEQQLERIGTQARQSFLRHIVSELTRNQQHCLDQARRQLQEQTEHHLQLSRWNFAELLKRVGEMLIRQAYLEGAVGGELLPAASDMAPQPASPTARTPAENVHP